MAGFSPSSIYASWSAAEQLASDRTEEQYNQGMRCRLAEQVGARYVAVAPDDSLQNLATVYDREREDIGRGDLCGDKHRAHVVALKLGDLEREQGCRAALAQSWLASEDGTHCYTAYVARGGLDAVHNYGARRPSYQLAAMLDRLNWRRGLPHVLAWDAERTGQFGIAQVAA
jgi:hypothetical protein